MASIPKPTSKPRPTSAATASDYEEEKNHGPECTEASGAAEDADSMARQGGRQQKKNRRLRMLKKGDPRPASLEDPQDEQDDESPAGVPYLPPDPTASALADPAFDDSFEAKCKELFEPAMDPLQMERQRLRRQRELHRHARDLYKQAAIGYGPIRTADTLVGATYDSQAVVPYGATKAKVSMRASAARHESERAIGLPPP
jgi:hypothetical protein